jgi:hypothetical protein
MPEIKMAKQVRNEQQCSVSLLPFPTRFNICGVLGFTGNVVLGLTVSVEAWSTVIQMNAETNTSVSGVILIRSTF